MTDIDFKATRKIYPLATTKTPSKIHK